MATLTGHKWNGQPAYTLNWVPSAQAQVNGNHLALARTMAVEGELIIDCRFGASQCARYTAGKTLKTDAEVRALLSNKQKPGHNASLLIGSAAAVVLGALALRQGSRSRLDHRGH